MEFKMSKLEQFINRLEESISGTDDFFEYLAIQRGSICTVVEMLKVAMRELELFKKYKGTYALSHTSELRWIEQVLSRLNRLAEGVVGADAVREG
jgi:hypothetical protein